MPKVKCRFCGKQIDRDAAYKVKHGKSNYYYCSLEHSIARKPCDIFYSEVFRIIGETTHTVFFKEMNEISKVHGFEKMTAYLKDNEQEIEKYMNKEFSSEYARIKYFSAILRNNLGDYQMKQHETVVHKDIAVEMYETKYKPKKERVGMDNLLDGLLDDD